MTVWARMPLIARVSLAAAVFLLAGLNPLNPSFTWGIWFGLVVGLYLMRAYRLRLVHWLYLGQSCLTAVYAAVYLVASGRPLSDGSGFWAHYPQFMLYLLGVLLVVSGVGLDEWIALIKRVGGDHRAAECACVMIVALSAGVQSAAQSIRRIAQARRLSRPRWWTRSAPPTVLERLISHGSDEIEEKCVLGAESAEALWEDVESWKRTLRIRLTDETRTAIRLNEIYELEGFTELFHVKFGCRPVSEEWRMVLPDLLRPGSGAVVDIGAGEGRLTLLLASLGLSVYAVEANSRLASACRDGTGQFGGSVTVVTGLFPSAVSDRRFGSAVLHQNVLIELLNEVGLDGAWCALRDCLTPGGFVVCDYPSRTCSLEEGQKITWSMKRDCTVCHVSYSQRPRAGHIFKRSDAALDG